MMGTAPIRTTLESLNRRHLKFAGLSVLLVVVLHRTFATWLQLAWHNEEYTFLWMIPLISAGLIYRSRREVFARMDSAPDGMVLIALGVVLCAVAHLLSPRLGPIASLTVAMLGVQMFSAGLFRLCYGRHAWRGARFAFAFLIFMVPVPEVVIEKAIEYLQSGSAVAVEGFFTLLQVPYTRHAMYFVLPGLRIEIAPECSGIRSSIALLLLVVLVAHFALRSRWRQLLLVASVIPLVLFKNGLRISTLSLLAIKVDRGFMTGSLHHQGGFVFFGMTLLAVVAFCKLLQHSEQASPNRQGAETVSG
jgi:exosortase